jgi:RHS repeat-associated protein
VTDATGKSVWEALYKPFGEASVHPSSTIVNNFRFPGQYYDQETGLHYNYHRYYDPRTGRYLTADPIGFAGGINVFAYVGNDPINWSDLLGLSKAVFDPSTNSIYVYPGDTPDVQGPPQRFPASNRPSNTFADPCEPEGHGPVPEGTFPTVRFIETGGDPNSAFGSGFIPIVLPLKVPYAKPRTGVGIHAGRADTQRGYMYGTEGCIRTTEEALNAFRNDPLTQITILPR